MAVIGVTGGIGSGKSTFSKMLADHLSARLFDADSAARELLESDPAVRQEITTELFAEAYSPDGKPDRAAIRRLVFHDPAAKARLNFPKYATLDAKGGVLILDTENHCLRRYDPATRTLRTVAGNGAKGSAVGADWTTTQLNRPQGARLGPDGRLYVADTGNNRILVGPAP